MKDVIFCKAVKAKVIKDERCPDWACDTCPELPEDQKPDIAKLYLIKPDNLPLPFWPPPDRVVKKDLKYNIPKVLKRLRGKYDEDSIRRLCGALFKFCMDIDRGNKSWNPSKIKTKAIKKEIGYLKKAQEASKFSDEMYYVKKIEELEGYLRAISTPSILAPLKARSGSPPKKRPFGKHGSLIKPLRKVIYTPICAQESGKEKAKETIKE